MKLQVTDGEISSALGQEAGEKSVFRFWHWKLIFGSENKTWTEKANTGIETLVATWRKLYWEPNASGPLPNHRNVS